jgi:hypothetical protein
MGPCPENALNPKIKSLANEINVVKSSYPWDIVV